MKYTIKLLILANAVFLAGLLFGEISYAEQDYLDYEASSSYCTSERVAKEAMKAEKARMLKYKQYEKELDFDNEFAEIREERSLYLTEDITAPVPESGSEGDVDTTTATSDPEPPEEISNNKGGSTKERDTTDRILK